jgi:ATP-dependent Clp protease ATP-binding subunit ClpA
MMLGLIKEDSGMAARVLRSLGISLETARSLVEQVLGRGEQAPPGQPQFTPRAKKLLEMASGLAAGSDRIGTQHILSALIREGQGVGAMVLFTLGVDQHRVGFRVIQLRDRAMEPTDEISRLLDNPLARIDALDRRLAAVERSLGMPPNLGPEQIERTSPETETTVDMQEFETATGLRGPDRQQPVPRPPRLQQLQRAAANPLSLARELNRVHAELDRLRAILRQHDIDPGDDPA